MGSDQPSTTTVTDTAPSARVPAPRRPERPERPLPTDGLVGLWVEYALQHATGVC